MASTTAICSSYKEDLLDRFFTGDTIRVALYTSSATNGASTTAYSATNEVSGTGYTAGGETTTPTVTLSGTTAYVDLTDVTWASSTITAASCLIYNDTDTGDPAIQVHDFGGDVSSSSGDFVITMPAADASNAIIRLA